MKPYLLNKSQDFGFDATLPPGHQDLIRDLELNILLQAMAAGDDYLLDVCRKVLLACLPEPGAIRFRQQVLADCLAHPGPIRAAYDGTALVIITGANSGGKSMFLRSAGQAQLMMQCGLFVTAQSYRASVARAVFTHFIREEDADMISGRLDEELRRMSTIADQIGPGSLMLFNESFAGTNEREGAEIGRQIVSALLEAGIRVLFVTHRFGLAEHFRDHRAGETLFLRAEREPDGRRSYQLAAKDPLPTSYGEDLYYQHGRWLGESERTGLAGPAAGSA